MTCPIFYPEQPLPAPLKSLADKFKLSIVSEPAQPFQLIWQQDSLQLLQTEIAKQGAIWVDFASPQSEYRKQQASIKNESIAKAVGLKAGKRPTVLDATAGLGRDAFVLASLGCQVEMVERHSVVAALLDDGLRRAHASDMQSVSERMQLTHASSLDYLLQVGKRNADEKPQVVYLDPMYPHPTNKKKAAAVKKEMKAFQSLVGADLDADGLFAAAREAATERVVVKRPDYADNIANTKPSHVISAKKNRFDVYML